MTLPGQIRKQGTGSIRHLQGSWIAYTPKVPGKKVRCVGKFDYRFQAERALEAALKGAS
jgi:hypothetical protein